MSNYHLRGRPVIINREMDYSLVELCSISKEIRNVIWQQGIFYIKLLEWTAEP